MIRSILACMIAAIVCGLTIYGVVVLNDFRYFAAGTAALDIVLVWYFGKAVVNLIRSKK